MWPAGGSAFPVPSQIRMLGSETHADSTRHERRADRHNRHTVLELENSRHFETRNPTFRKFYTWLRKPKT
jgi:hypothetical protein